MKKRNIWLIVASTVVILLIAGGIAGWKWHQQPSFCSVVCHKVMAPYYESWQEGDLLAAVHAKADVKCLDCHESTVSEQISEIQKYVSGDYETPLPFKKLARKDLCLKCHGTYADLAEKTKDYSGGKANPHDNHNGESDCYVCHKVHETSTFYCNQCHEWDKPADWK